MNTEELLDQYLIPDLTGLVLSYLHSIEISTLTIRHIRGHRYRLVLPPIDVVVTIEVSGPVLRSIDSNLDFSCALGSRAFVLGYQYFNLGSYHEKRLRDFITEHNNQ